MKLLNIKNKKGMNISILVLVLMTLSLIGVALIAFARTDKVEHQVQNVFFIEEVYIKEQQIKFFIHQLVRETINEMEEDWDKDRFQNDISIKAEKILDDEFIQEGPEIYLKNILERVKQKRYSITDIDEEKIILVFEEFYIGIVKSEKQETRIGSWMLNSIKRILPFFSPEIVKSERPVLSVSYKTDLDVVVRFEKIETQEDSEEEQDEDLKELENDLD
jgi:hypothetical protein